LECAGHPALSWVGRRSKSSRGLGALQEAAAREGVPWKCVFA